MAKKTKRLTEEEARELFIPKDVRLADLPAEELEQIAPDAMEREAEFKWLLKSADKLEKRRIQRIREEATAEGNDIQTEAIMLGKEKYRIDGRDIAVTYKEGAVLTVLISDGPLTKAELIDRSGYEDADRVLGKLRNGYEGAFAKVIRCPGGRGKGGYSTSILPQT